MYSIERILYPKFLARPSTDGLVPLMLNYLLRQFALGMVSTFGVLFIFQLTGSFFQGLVCVIVFFGLQRLVVFLTIHPFALIISRTGYRWSMFFSLLALAAKLFLFSITSQDYLWPLIPALILGGCVISAYYLSYHAIFLDDNEESKIGEQAGALDTLERLAMVVSPLISGFIIEAYGFSKMFFLTMFVLIISVIPLLTMKYHKRHVGNYSLKAVLDFIKKRPKTTWSMYMWIITVAIQGFYWPIYLFSIIGSYKLFGIVGGFVMMVSSIAIYFAGKLYDKRSLKTVFWGSSVLVSITWIGRFLSSTPFVAVAADAFNRLFSPSWWMKIRRQELLAGEEVDSLVFGAAHEYLQSAGVVSGLFIGYLILLFSGGNWVWLTVPAVLGTLASTWILRKD